MEVSSDVMGFDILSLTASVLPSFTSISAPRSFPALYADSSQARVSPVRIKPDTKIK